MVSVPQVSLMTFEDALQAINTLTGHASPWNELYVWSFRQQRWDHHR